MKRLAMIFAMDQNGLVGKDGTLPWHAPRDLKWFKAATLNKTMIMGRRTWDSLGRPLPKRTSIVVSSAPRPSALPEPVHWVNSLDDALALGQRIDDGQDEMLIIGGPTLCELAKPHVARFYRTILDATYDGDCWFDRDFASDWQASYRGTVPATGDTPAMTIEVLNRH
ncbi:MAG: dihydrofolate reductase [Gammaproteobacteria bacterium]|nr:dihydrofolate reductase [Gammaproteobacteria bacterium]